MPGPDASQPIHVVVMGVAGCGKSAVGERIVRALGVPLIEGDDFHPPGNIDKMRRGLPLTDDDRAGWLSQLADELRRRPAGAVLTCSALKRSYRDVLRTGARELKFIHLSLTPEAAQERVAARAGHFYPTSLVASQFDALEDPAGESGVIVVDATLPLDEVTNRALQGLAAFR